MKKAYILAFIALYFKLFSFSFWYTDAISGDWEEAAPLTSSIGFYSLAGCGLTSSQISTALSTISPSVSVEGAPSFYFIDEIDSLEEPHNEGVLIRKELSPSEVPDEPYYNMVVDLSNKVIIINTDYTPTIHDLMHECGHIAGLGHSNIATAIMYDTSNSITTLHTDDKYGLYSHYNKPDIVESAVPQVYLKGINANMPVIFNSLGKSSPQSYTVDLWDDTPIVGLEERQKLLDVVTLTNQGQTNSNIEEWDSSELASGSHKLSVYLTGSQDCSGTYPELVSYPQRDEPMDELEVKLYDLKFRSPEYNKEYSVYAPLEFEVFGKSDDGEISILEIENIGSVEYLLENGLGSNVFPLTSTDISTNFEFTQELSSISGLSTGTYYVSVYVKDLQGELIAEIEEMPILINTRSIQIERETTDEFMVYDFENAQNPYLTGKFYHEDGIQNKDFSFFDGNNVELYDVDWCESYGSNQGVFAGVYPSSLLITDDSYVWDSTKWPGSKKSTKCETLNYSEIITPVAGDSIENTSKDFSAMTWYFDFSGGLLKLRPGLYRFHGNAYVKSSFPQTLVKMADTDTLTLFIPSWKMKTELDMRFGKDRVHFRKGDDIEICIWRPVNGLKANSTQVFLYSENKAQLLGSQTVSYADSLGVTTMVNFPTTGLDYGFYTIEAKEIDYTTGREVVYQNEIQVCPLYVRWENGGLWPSDWPGTDNSYWKLAQFANTDPVIKSYTMKNNYDYDTGLYPLMNTQLTSPSVTLTKPYNAFMLIYIGLERLNNIFDELLAEYTVSVSVNNKASWDIIKTSTAAEWATYPWPTQLDRWCFTSAGTSIKYTNQPIYVKLSGIDTKGIPRDTVFTEGVMYDEVMIAYTKADLLEKPENLSGQFYEAGKYSAVQLTWDHSPDYQTGRYYRLYRDGIVIADELTSLSYLDYSTVPDRMYNYIVTIVDPYKYSDDPAYESPKAGSGINFYTGLLSPSGLAITEESPNVRLTWSPVSGASGYKVYSCDDPYGTFEEDLSGTFNGEEWVAPLTESRLFYYVVAVNENKQKIKILRSSGNQVK